MVRAVIVHWMVIARSPSLPSSVAIVESPGTGVATILSDFDNSNVIFMEIRPPFLPDHRTSWLGDAIECRRLQE